MKHVLLIFLFFAVTIFPQHAVKEYISAIEKGNGESVKKNVEAGLRKEPGNPDLMYASALLTSDGDEAAKLYSKVAEAGSKSAYADAACYKLWQYYYAQGLYSRAQAYKEQLQKKYPKSRFTEAVESGVAAKPVLTNNMAMAEKQSANVQEIKNAAPKTTKAKKTGIMVQAGAFSKKENARDLQQKLGESQYTINMSEKNVGGTTFYIITADGFETTQEAKDFVEKINKKYSLQSRIVNR